MVTVTALALVSAAGSFANADIQSAKPPVPATYSEVAAKPYLGWSSWSLQSTNYPGVNPDGPGSFISEKNILIQANAMATKLKPFGYEYINIDAGWQLGGDEYGRPVANTARFPRGMKAVGDDLHKLGLKFGIYTVVGLGFDVYREGNTPIHNAPGCFTRDIVYPDLRTTNGWDQAYKINYASPCAQKYADSIAKLFASWGVDFIKMDGVGPGSWKGAPDDPNHNNTEDVEAWWRAVQDAGRPMQYTLSWSLSHRYAETWKQNSNGWRIDTDVECYCDTIVRWDGSVKQRWWDLPQWIDDAGPGHWNNLDAINVGVGEMDGLNEAERQSYMTFWAINAAPLFVGDDMTKLDAYGLKLLTNREVIAINQSGNPARPLNQDQLQQTWYAKNADGSVTVGLFNLAETPATVTGDFGQLGITGKATVRDVWANQNTPNVSGQVSASLPAHGSKLYKIFPNSLGSVSKPADLTATDVSRTTVSLTWRPSTEREVLPGLREWQAGGDQYQDQHCGHGAAAADAVQVRGEGCQRQQIVGRQRSDHHVHRQGGRPGPVRGGGREQHADRQRERQRLHAVLGRPEDRQHRLRRLGDTERHHRTDRRDVPGQDRLHRRRHQPAEHAHRQRRQQLLGELPRPRRQRLGHAAGHLPASEAPSRSQLDQGAQPVGLHRRHRLDHRLAGWGRDRPPPALDR